MGGQDALALEAAVRHDDGGSVPGNAAGNDRHGSQPRQFPGVFAAASNPLIAALLPWPCQHGDATLLDAFGGFPHGRVIPHLKRVIGNRVQCKERNPSGSFPLRFRLLGDGAGFLPGSFCAVFSGIVFLLPASAFG